MTTFTTLVSGDLDPDSPITTNLANAWYGNPLAIAEDDATAPVFKGRIRDVQLATSLPVSSYAVGADEQLIVAVTVSLNPITTGGGPYTATVNVQHNSVTIGTTTITIDGTSTLTPTIFGYTTTNATGNIDVTSSYTGNLSTIGLAVEQALVVLITDFA